MEYPRTCMIDVSQLTDHDEMVAMGDYYSSSWVHLSESGFRRLSRLKLNRILTAAPCPADLDGNGSVDFGDLVTTLSMWGPCAGCPEDLDGDGQVGFGDIVAVLSTWGPCP